jgi:multidrug efflux system outer membrane protein
MSSRIQLASLGGLLIGIAIFGGCAVGPDYKRPTVDAPAEFRFSENQKTNSLADLPWWQVFQDPVLQGLIRTALTNNYDLKQAVARVEQARYQSVAANGAFLPQIDYAGNAGRGRNALYNSPADLNGATRGSALVNLSAFWEIDFWGRIRRSSEAARAQYLATEEARRSFSISLMSEVASTYFQLLDLDQELEIERAATNAYAGSYRLFSDRLSQGVASKLETDRAAAALANAQASIPDLELRIVQTENQLSVLLGKNPGPVLRQKLDDQNLIAPEIPAGLPSALILRRPDILAAEQSLVAANANAGVNLANFFPQIGLTTLLGSSSAELSTFTAGSGNLWNLGGTLSGPVFHGGQLKAQYKAAKAKFDESAAAYQQSVLTAFKEVSDALIARQKLAEEYVFQGQSVAALTSSVELATQRYMNGKSSYYEVLQAQQELYPAQRTQVQTRTSELISTVQLYKALGGGWSVAEDGEKSRP